MINAGTGLIFTLETFRLKGVKITKTFALCFIELMVAPGIKMLTVLFVCLAFFIRDEKAGQRTGKKREESNGRASGEQQKLKTPMIILSCSEMAIPLFSPPQILHRYKP